MAQIQSLAQELPCAVGAAIKKKKIKEKCEFYGIGIAFQFTYLFFLGLYLQHIEVPRLGIQLESAAATATLGSKPHLPPTLKL